MAAGSWLYWLVITCNLDAHTPLLMVSILYIPRLHMWCKGVATQEGLFYAYVHKQTHKLLLKVLYVCSQ